MKLRLPTQLLVLAALSRIGSSLVTKAQTAPTPTADIASIQTSPVVAESPLEDDGSTIFNGQRVPKMKELGGKTLDELIKDGYTMVKFYSPSCPHCIHVAPYYQTLYEFYWTSKPVRSSSPGEQQSLNDFHHYYKYDFASVNCIAFGDTCTKWEANSFPTFVLFKEGEAIQRLVGAKDMKGLSTFFEEGLEMIRPGSRVKDGPELPEVGDKIAPGFDPATLAPTPGSGTSLPKPTSLSSTKKHKKPVKPATTPNISGSSVSLTAESFQSLVTLSQDPWFIKFYAPWCSHCKAMAPNWNQLAKEMKGRLNIGDVNCEAESRLCKEVRLRGYPTLLFFRGGERVEYDGLRGLGDFVSYANKAIEISDGVRDVDATEFKEMEEKEEVIFVYFYDHATTSEDFIALERLTLSLIGHAKLVKTKDKALYDRFKITTWPRLMVSRDGRPTYYTALAPQDTRDFRQVLQWMKSVWLPIVPELTASNSREIMDGKLVVLGILSRDRPEEFMIAKNEIKSAALEWMDKQTQLFQLERQDLRDTKQLRIEEAEARNDQRALRHAKGIRINMDKSERKEVGFAWVDGVFWERWIRTTYGIEVRNGEKVIINDEDNRRYWDETITGNFIMPSRTSILETIPKVVATPPKIKPKLTISNFEKVFFDIWGAASEHPLLTIGLVVGVIVGGGLYIRKRLRRGRGPGFFKLDEKDGLLGGNNNGKVD